MKNSVITRANDLAHEWDRRAIDHPTCNQDTIVWDIGSYRGRWSYQMATRYNPKLYLFEPQPWAHDICVGLLQDYNVNCFNYGLGRANGRFPMGEWGTDGAGFTVNTRAQGQGEMRDISEVWESLGYPQIDIMMINIEGGEFTLIPYMISKGITPTSLMVQMHDNNRDRSIDLLSQLTAVYGPPKWYYGLTLSMWSLI